MKFEERLKEKLEQRQINPSTDAWSKLQDKLDGHNTNKNNKGFWWLGIAASIVGVLMLVVFMKEGSPVKIDEILVETEVIPTPIEINKSEENIIDNKPLLTQTPLTEDKKETPVKKKKTSNQPILKDKVNKEQLKLFPKSTDKVSVATNDKPQESLKENLSLEEQKAKDVVAQIQEIQKTHEVTEAEIEALLKKAQKEITLERMYNEATKKVDANALLQSVEEDILDQSFRARVFEMLKSGYKEVKTAVAERNN